VKKESAACASPKGDSFDGKGDAKAYLLVTKRLPCLGPLLLRDAKQFFLVQFELALLLHLYHTPIPYVLSRRRIFPVDHRRTPLHSRNSTCLLRPSLKPILHRLKLLDRAPPRLLVLHDVHSRSIRTAHLRLPRQALHVLPLGQQVRNDALATEDVALRTSLHPLLLFLII